MPKTHSSPRMMGLLYLGLQDIAKICEKHCSLLCINKVLLFFITAILLFPSSAHATYWNVFNFEGESSSPAEVITYATLTDMLNDTNRTGDFTPNGQGFNEARNLVGSGADVAQSTAVPEPSSLPLLCMGVLGFGLLLRLKRGGGTGRTSVA